MEYGVYLRQENIFKDLQWNFNLGGQISVAYFIKVTINDYIPNELGVMGAWLSN